MNRHNATNVSAKSENKYEDSSKLNNNKKPRVIQKFTKRPPLKICKNLSKIEESSLPLDQTIDQQFEHIPLDIIKESVLFEKNKNTDVLSQEKILDKKINQQKEKVTSYNNVINNDKKQCNTNDHMILNEQNLQSASKTWSLSKGTWSLDKKTPDDIHSPEKQFSENSTESKELLSEKQIMNKSLESSKLIDSKDAKHSALSTNQSDFDLQTLKKSLFEKNDSQDESAITSNKMKILLKKLKLTCPKYSDKKKCSSTPTTPSQSSPLSKNTCPSPANKTLPSNSNSININERSSKPVNSQRRNFENPCYNCGCIGHGFRYCSQPLRTNFCRRCGWEDVVYENCPYCTGKLIRPGSSKPVPVGGGARKKFKPVDPDEIQKKMNKKKRR